MTKEQFCGIMPLISSDLIAMISKEEHICLEEAMKRLYMSELYAMLEQEETRVWHYSTHMLYFLFKNEQEKGVLEFPDV